MGQVQIGKPWPAGIPSFRKLATFVLGFFHCFQMYIRNQRRSHAVVVKLFATPVAKKRLDCCMEDIGAVVQDKRISKQSVTKY